MTQTTVQPAQLSGAASYPPAYNAPGARLERAYPRYINARLRKDPDLVAFARAVVVSTIDTAVRGAR